jgi:hypothetical protein
MVGSTKSRISTWSVAGIGVGDGVGVGGIGVAVGVGDGVGVAVGGMGVAVGVGDGVGGSGVAVGVCVGGTGVAVGVGDGVGVGGTGVAVAVDAGSGPVVGVAVRSPGAQAPRATATPRAASMVRQRLAGAAFLILDMHLTTAIKGRHFDRGVHVGMDTTGVGEEAWLCKDVTEGLVSLQGRAIPPLAAEDPIAP